MNRQQRRHEASQKRRAYNQAAKQVRERDDASGWDELHQIRRECQALLVRQSLALPLMRDQATIAMMDAEDRRKIIDLSKVIVRDAAHYDAQLNEIYNLHNSKNGKTGDGDDLMGCLMIGEQYAQWMNSYQSVVLPNIETFLTIFDKYTSANLANGDDATPVNGGEQE